jgi:hypothetical protein
MAHYNLSFHDLMLVDGFKDAFESQNTKVLEAILQTNGMDVSIGYELVHCTHRTINKIEYTGIRVEGFERLDAAWLATGAASMEAQIESVKDIHLRHDLRKMRSSGCASIEATHG